MISTARELQKMLADGDTWEDLTRVGDEVEGWKVIDRIVVHLRRWTQWIDIIVEERFTGDTYKFSYQAGLTEYQEAEYVDQLPVRVYPYDEVITIRKWTTEVSA